MYFVKNTFFLILILLIFATLGAWGQSDQDGGGTVAPSATPPPTPASCMNDGRDVPCPTPGSTPSPTTKPPTPVSPTPMDIFDGDGTRAPTRAPSVLFTRSPTAAPTLRPTSMGETYDASYASQLTLISVQASVSASASASAWQQQQQQSQGQLPPNTTGSADQSMLVVAIVVPIGILLVLISLLAFLACRMRRTIERQKTLLTSVASEGNHYVDPNEGRQRSHSRSRSRRQSTSDKYARMPPRSTSGTELATNMELNRGAADGSTLYVNSAAALRSNTTVGGGTIAQQPNETYGAFPQEAGGQYTAAPHISETSMSMYQPGPVVPSNGDTVGKVYDTVASDTTTGDYMSLPGNAQQQATSFDTDSNIIPMTLN